MHTDSTLEFIDEADITFVDWVGERLQELMLNLSTVQKFTCHQF
jgi:hypothetical protein